MYCPKCRIEYRKGFTTCADCNVPLVYELPPEPAGASEQNTEGVEYVSPHFIPKDYTLLRTFNSSSETILARGLLEGAGIEIYTMAPDNVGQVTGRMSAPISKHSIYVHRKDIQLAEDLLKTPHKINDSETDNRSKKNSTGSLLGIRVFLIIMSALFFALANAPIKKGEEQMKYAALSFVVLFLSMLVLTFKRRSK